MAGKCVTLDLSSVKTDAAKTSAFLKNKLSKAARQTCVVVFLGEQHRNAVDTAVAQAMPTSPPIVDNGATRVIYERGLNAAYVEGASFTTSREEAMTDLSKVARSKLLADMIIDAFDNDNVTAVYMPCGSAHAEEVFNALDKRCTKSFTFFLKPSSTD